MAAGGAGVLHDRSGADGATYQEALKRPNHHQVDETAIGTGEPFLATQAACSREVA